MLPFYRVDGLTRVHPAWQGKPILSAKQIEDVVAFSPPCITKATPNNYRCDFDGRLGLMV
jgi:hypothetical protein